jgi:hypothetical protein
MVTSIGEKLDVGELIAILSQRFAANMQRHPGVAWGDVEARLRSAASLGPLVHMES